MAEHTELIPMDDPGSGFDIVMRGYDRAQVTEQIERLEAELRVAGADRESAAARSGDLASQLASSHAVIESLRSKLEQTGLPTYERMGERIASMLNLAQAEADDLRRRAEEQAAETRGQTDEAVRERRKHLDAIDAELRSRRQAVEQQCAQLIFSAEGRAKSIVAEAEVAAERERKRLTTERRTSDEARAAADEQSRVHREQAAADADTARQQADDEARAAREEARSELQQHIAAAQRERAEADEQARLAREHAHADLREHTATAKAAQESADRDAHERRTVADASAAAARAEADEDFDITQRVRRTQLHQEHERRQRESIEQARSTVADADAYSQRAIADAQRQVAGLTAERDEILRQLRTLHGLLLGAPDRAGLPGDAPGVNSADDAGLPKGQPAQRNGAATQANGAPGVAAGGGHDVVAVPTPR